MMRYILLLIFIFFSFSSYTQQVQPSSSGEIYKEMRLLKTLPKVLYLAAHPDDENTGLLSWLVNHQHINTAYLSLTRGDGGQNLIGSEQGAALGLIRTHELLEARKVDGARQFFSRAIDFGFSKNPDDTFKQWNLDSITSDVVWVIRKYRPDIIVTRFPPTSAAGHGQHAASAIIAKAAFQAAGDPRRYPEQLKHVEVWQPERLLWNTFRFGSVNTTSENQFKTTVGQYDPLAGMGHGELAGISRSLHQSQGAGTPSVAGIKTEYFTLVAGSPVDKSLFDGLKRTWTDLQRNDIDQEIDQLIRHFNFLEPDLSIPQLLKIKGLLKSIDDIALRNEKQHSIDKIILSSAGFMAEMITSQPEAMAGEDLNFNLNVIARSKTPIRIQQIRLPSDGNNKIIKNLDKTLFNDSLTKFNYQVKIPKNAEISEPYWLKSPSENTSQYQVKVDSLIGRPLTPSSLNAELVLNLGGETFHVAVPFSFKKLDPIRGDVVESLRIVPVVNIRFTRPFFFYRIDSPLILTVNIRSHKDISNATLRIKNGTKLLETFGNIHIESNQDSILKIPISADRLKELFPGGSKSQDSRDNIIDADLEVDQTLYNKNLNLIRYSHIPTLQYYTTAKTKIINSNLKVSVKRIGYLQGAGDPIPDFLRIAGMEVTILEESNFLNLNELMSFEAIVMGIRAVNVERRLQKWMPVLHKYIYNGGTLIMQFNTLQDMATTNIGPYPLTIGRDRVTEENTKVTLLAPGHPILNFPNKIEDSDFQGWIQERGLYFPSQWDNRYLPLFEMHDTGEDNLKGATLYTAYGTGHFIYTSLSFFRQISIGHEGAAKLFFNMLSIGKNEKEFK